MEMEGPYDAKKVEDRIYKLWEDSGFFNPDNLPVVKLSAPRSLGEVGRKSKNPSSLKLRRTRPFTIVMPPTNANGSLHAGHALVMTIEDIMTRYKRMRGFKALWLPGLDHAGFETQVVYEKQLEKEGRSRFQMTRDQLYQEILDFTLKNKQNIESQIRSMGASCDWSREKFMLDKDVVATVYETFESLYKDGLVYRGKKIINWCPKHQTSLSDLETTDTQKADKFYYLKYGPFVIATARPETKFGDKYVVMHPKDSKYSQYHDGQKIELEWINGPITATVIKDEAIDMEFGTGVMTITPWHDAVDFEIAQRHNLDKEQVIDFTGKLLPIAGEFAGMKILEARPKIVEKLQSKGLVEKIEENYTHTVKTCYKCGNLIEPQIKDQWFLKMKPLAKEAIGAIKKNQVTFIPSHYKKISLYWLENIMDWPLSRQIVWGIPIPAKFCQQCDNTVIDTADKLTHCPICKGELKKDPDTFDTWFSSGQWPFATLGFPKGKDFKTFYPTDVMETAGEIIFFWVTRMIMLGLYRTKKVPFKTVYLHGLVLDAKGQKMSKSKGNVINPLDITAKYGTDALRIGLVVGNTPGTSLALDENRIKGYKNFANKIWNASKFVLINTQDYKSKKIVLSAKQKKQVADFKKIVKKITKQMDDFKFYSAAEDMYHYFWHVFCDKVIEESKPAFAFTSAEATADEKAMAVKEREAAQYVLISILSDSLKLLHPFMPFITEEIYQKLPTKKQKLLMIEEWPS